MNLTIERSALIKGMAMADSVAEARNTIPILSNVLLDARDGKLRATSTDLDIQIELEMPAEVHSPGKITVNSDLLYGLAKKMPEGAQVAIDLDQQSTRITVKSGRSRFQLLTLPAEDFPDLAVADTSHKFMMSAPALYRFIEKTLFAISTEETRYYLNGVYLDFSRSDGEPLCAVSTDGHRLAKCWHDAPEGSNGAPSIIIPRKTCQLLGKLLADVKDEVVISTSSAKIVLEFDGVKLVSKLIDGTFPDYERVIPKGINNHVFGDKAQFLEALERLKIVQSKDGRATKFQFEAGKPAVLSARNGEGDEAEETIEVDYQGPPLTVGFNSSYVSAVLNRIDSKRFKWEISDAGSPAILGNEEASDSLYVIMPLRV